MRYTGSSTPKDEIVVPNVLGKTAVAANALIVGNGLNIKIEGTKNYLSGTGTVVVEQSPVAGVIVPRGTVVTVTFRSLDGDYIDDDALAEVPEDSAESASSSG